MSGKKEKLYPSDIRRISEGLNLPQAHRHVLHVIHSYQGGNSNSWPSLTKLARGVGVCKRHLIRLLNDLEERGLLTRERRGHLTNLYLVVAPRSLPGSDTQVTKVVTSRSLSSDTQVTTGSDIYDTEKCLNPMPDVDFPSPKKSEKNSKNKSVNQSGKSGPTDRPTNQKKTSSSKKPAPKDGEPLAWNEGKEDFPLGSMREESFAPPPGAPPCLTPEKIYALFGGPAPRPQNLLDCPEGDFVLRDLTAPFKKGPEVKEVIGFDPNTPQDRWFEEALEEFSREAFDRHWHRDAKPPGPAFKSLFRQAARSGLLYAYGFHPLSPEQQEMRRRELERKEEEEAEVARLLAQKKARFRKFINRPVVRKYLILRRFSLENHEAIKAHLRELVDNIGSSSLTALERFMKGEVRAEKAMKRRHEQIKELRLLAEGVPRLIESFVQKGILSEADDFMFSEYECLDYLLAVGQGLQIEGLGDMAQAFINQTQ